MRIKQFNYRAQVTVPAAGSGDTVRFIVFIDTETLGVAASATDILLNANTYSPFQLRNVSCPGRTRNRFAILRDQTVDLNNGAGTVTTVDKTVSFRIPLNMQAFYQSNANTVSDCLKNHIGVLVISIRGVANVLATGQICFLDQ